MTDLIPDDATLEYLEAVIETNLAGAMAVASALTVIHDRKLYKPTHATWETYCLERWQMSRSAAWRQIGQSKALAELPSGSTAPSQRAVARARTQNVAHPPSEPPVTREDPFKVRDETPKPPAFIPSSESGGIDTSQIITYEVIIRPDADLGKQILAASKKAKMPAYDWVILAVQEKLSAIEEESDQVAQLKAENKRLTTELNAALTVNHGLQAELAKRVLHLNPTLLTHELRSPDPDPNAVKRKSAKVAKTSKKAAAAYAPPEAEGYVDVLQTAKNQLADGTVMPPHTSDTCPHPKKEEKNMGWGVVCGLCNERLR